MRVRTGVVLLALTASCGRVGFDATSDAGPPGDAPTTVGGPDGSPGQLPIGAVLFEELFDDGDFGTRGWYDGPAGALTTAVTAPGSESALLCVSEGGECAAGAPRRLQFAFTESLYLGYWVRYEAGFTGGSEMWLMTDADDAFVGPSFSRLTLVNSVTADGRVEFRLEDNANIDEACILLTNGQSFGCGGGTADTYPFTEARSVAACNGLAGDVDRWECFEGGQRYFSRRYWSSDTPAFNDDPGDTRYRDAWHYVEILAVMNSIEGGVGVPDGELHYVRDGETMFSSESILFRTAEFPALAFNQLYLWPSGFTTAGHKAWFDDLTIATGRGPGR